MRENDMEQTTIKEKTIHILDNMFSDSRIDKDVIEYVDLVDDLGMDSINFISLIIELETLFDVQIPDDWMLIERFRSYSLIYSAIVELLAQKETEGGNGEQ